jgi:hypothetical protein
MVQAARLQYRDFSIVYPAPGVHKNTKSFPLSGTIYNWSQIVRSIPAKKPKVKGKIKPVLLLLPWT